MEGSASMTKRSSGSRFILFLAFSSVCAGILILIAKCSSKSKYVLPDDDGVFVILFFFFSFLFGALREGVFLIRDGMKRFSTSWSGWFKNRRESEKRDKSHQT